MQNKNLPETAPSKILNLRSNNWATPYRGKKYNSFTRFYYYKSLEKFYTRKLGENRNEQHVWLHGE